jgi:hypothetical protein
VFCRSALVWRLASLTHHEASSKVRESHFFGATVT